MKIIGLTGSIAMGKTEASKALAAMGYPVFDSDKVVHQLYADDKDIFSAIRQAFPQAVVAGAIDRKILGALVFDAPDQLKKLEQIIHPRVRERRDQFINEAKAQGEECVILDWPLLFETNGRDLCDAVLVVTAPPDVQKERVLSRPNMTEEKFAAIKSKQMPDAEKRALADFVISTNHGIEAMKTELADAVRLILAD